MIDPIRWSESWVTGSLGDGTIEPKTALACYTRVTEEHIRREETAGAVEVVHGKPRRRAKDRIDYTLRVKNNPVRLIGSIVRKDEPILTTW